MEIGFKLLFTMILVMLITGFVGLFGSIYEKERISCIAATALFIEVFILLIGIIISIWL